MGDSIEMKRILSFLILVVMVGTFLVGCSSPKEDIKNVRLEDLVNKIKEEMGESYYPNREMEMEEIEEIIGLSKDDIEEFIAEGPMMSVSVDTLMAFKAKEGKGSTIQEGLDTYRDSLVNDSLQYPMNLAKIEASKVVAHGDYVFFIMVGEMDDRDEASDEERLEFAASEVSKVEGIIGGFFK